jgi:hypothetical protein
MDSYAVNKAKPLGSWKAARRTAREQAGVKCWMHDLRHSVVTKLGEMDTPSAVIRAISCHSTSGRSLRRNGAWRSGIARAHFQGLGFNGPKITFSWAPQDPFATPGELSFRVVNGSCTHC